MGIQALKEIYTFNTDENIVINLNSSCDGGYLYGNNIPNAPISCSTDNSTSKVFGKLKVGTYTDCYIGTYVASKWTQTPNFKIIVIEQQPSIPEPKPEPKPNTPVEKPTPKPVIPEHSKPIVIDNITNLDSYASKIFDLNKTYNLFNLSAKQGDTTGARGIIFQIVKNSIPFSLDGLKLQIGGVKPDGKIIFNDVKILDPSKSLIEIYLTTQMLAVSGVLKLELIILKDSVKLSSYPFEINIEPSITNFSTITSSNEFTTLLNALGKINGIDATIDSKIGDKITTLTNLITSMQDTVKDNTTNITNNSNILTNNSLQLITNTDNITALQNLLKGSENVQFGNITRCILTNGLKMYFGYVENNHPDNKWLGVKFPSDGFKDNNYTILSTPVNSGYDATVSIPTGSISPFKDGSGFSISIGDNIQGLFFMAISRP